MPSTSLASDLIGAAMRALGVTVSGETASSAEQADALSALNRMLSGWNIDGLVVSSKSITKYALAVSKQAYVLGSGVADFISSTGIPDTIETIVYIDASGSRHTVPQVNIQQWTSTTLYLTASGAIPTRCYIDKTFLSIPYWTLYFDPIPSTSGGTCFIELGTAGQLSSYGTLATSATLPDGYEEAIIFNLARRLAPEYGLTPRQDVLTLAGEGLMRVMSHNATTPMMSIDPALRGTSRNGFNWKTGELA